MEKRRNDATAAEPRLGTKKSVFFFQQGGRGEIIPQGIIFNPLVLASHVAKGIVTKIPAKKTSNYKFHFYASNPPFQTVSVTGGSIGHG